MEIEKYEYLENKKSFLDEMESIFRNFHYCHYLIFTLVTTYVLTLY